MASSMETIATAIKTTIDALATTPDSIIRKWPRSFQTDTYPIVLITYSNDDLSAGTADQSFEGWVFVRYSLLLVILTKDGQNSTLNAGQVPEWREKIRQAIQTPDLVAGVINAELDNNPDFDPSYLAQNVDYSAMLFTYTFLEERNG